MADSSHAPLLGHRSSGPSGTRSESTPCLFDRLSNPFVKIFTKSSLVVASGPFFTVCILIFSKYHGFNDGTADSAASSQKIGAMLGALVWMAAWWILEPVPIAITALLPIGIFPFFQIMKAGDVASAYTNDIVSLMLGSFIIALAIDRYSLHKRMALKILLLAGGEKMDPRLVLGGFIAGPAFISLWMANTSAAAMMVPMAVGVLHNLDHEHHVAPIRSKSRASLGTDEMAEEVEQVKDAKNWNSERISEEAEEKFAKEVIFKYSQGMILGVIYGIAVGGMGTLIGCGPNLVLPGIYRNRFPNAPEVTFLMWMKFAIPLVIPYLVATWLFMCQTYCPRTALPVIEASLNRNMIEKAYRSLGPLSFAEMFIFAEFCIIVVLWVTRSFGDAPGWAAVFNNFPDDGTVAVAASILLFMVPNFHDGKMLMDWKACKDIAWGVILVMGGGFALSKGIEESGVSTWLSYNMKFFEHVPHYLLAPAVATILSVITEFTSNAATATLFLPIFAEIALSINVHPLLLLIPATLASSYAFVLPSGNPPNAIALGTGYLVINDMGHPGLFMHIVGIVLIAVLTPTLGNYVFDLDRTASSLPWIKS